MTHPRAKQKPRTRTDSLLIQRAVLTFGLISIVLLMALYAINAPDNSAFRFNWYAVLSGVSLVTNLAGYFMLLRIKVRTEELQWFSVFQISLATWAGSELMLRLSANPETAAFWLPTTTIGSVVMPIALYLFAIAYTGGRTISQSLTVPTLLGAAVLYVFVDSRASVFTIYDPASLRPSPWGFESTAGPWFLLIILWLAVLSTVAYIVLYRFRKHTLDPVIQKQTRLFMIAILIPLIGGTLTDGLQPLLGVWLIPSQTVLLLTITGIIIVYGIVRYRFFNFTPGIIANQILGTMNEAVIGLSPDYQVRYVNAGAEHMLGLTASKLNGKRLTDLLARQTTPAELDKKITKALEGNIFATIEAVDFRRSNGKTVTTKVSITKLSDDKQPYGYLAVLADITEVVRASELVERQVVARTKELHEEQAKLRAAIEGLELGFILIDSGGKIIIQNQQLENIFDLEEPVSSLNQLNDKLVKLDLKKQCDVVAATGKPFVVPEVGMGPKILQIFIGPVKLNGGHVIGIMLMAEDVTEEKVLARSKDEFFSIASHELRTPLTAIKGNTSIMLEYYKQLINQDESFKQMVVDVHESSSRLIEIVRDFLDMSSIEQGKMIFRPETFAIDKIIESVFYEMRSSANGKGVQLKTNTATLGILPKVWADKDRITQIAYNLVGNAVKFTDEGSVGVNASIDGSFVRLEVSDTGRGIPLENQKFLFHKFQQAGDSLLTRDTTRGTGLGLYISKLMAENMGCELALKTSTEGKGSTFYLTIPIATAQQLNTSGTGPEHQQHVDTTTGLAV